MKTRMVSKLFASLLLVFLAVSSSAFAREKTLYAFPGGTGGNYPVGGVVADASGNLYGVTADGGTYGWGAVYELRRSNGGWTEELIYSFTGGADGFFPSGNLVIDSNGSLYGTTETGGTQTGCEGRYECGGTAFLLSKAGNHWQHKVLYNF